MGSALALLLQSSLDFGETTTGFSETLAYAMGALCLALVVVLRHHTKWAGLDASEKRVARAVRRAVRDVRRTQFIAPTRGRITADEVTVDVDADADADADQDLPTVDREPTPEEVRAQVAHLIGEPAGRAPRFNRLRKGFRRTLCGLSPLPRHRGRGQIRPTRLTQRPRIRAGRATMPGGSTLYIVRIDRSSVRGVHVLTGQDRQQVLDDVATVWAGVRAQQRDRTAKGVPGTASTYHYAQAHEGCVDDERVRARCHGDCKQRLRMNLRENRRLDVTLLFETFVYGPGFGYPPRVVEEKLRTLLHDETRLRNGEVVYEA